MAAIVTATGSADRYGGELGRIKRFGSASGRRGGAGGHVVKPGGRLCC